MLPGALLYRGTVHASRGDGGNTPPLTVWNQTWFQGQTLLHRSPCYTTSPAPVSTFWLVRVVGCVPLLAVLAPVFHPAQPTYLPHKPQHGVQWISLPPPSFPIRSCPTSILCTLPAGAKRSPSRPEAASRMCRMEWLGFVATALVVATGSHRWHLSHVGIPLPYFCRPECTFVVAVLVV